LHFVRSIAGNVDPRTVTHGQGHTRSPRVTGQGFSFPAIDLTKSN
jgi:hypothetical protein